MDVFDVCDLDGRRSRIVFCDCDAIKVLKPSEPLGDCKGCGVDLAKLAKALCLQGSPPKASMRPSPR